MTYNTDPYLLINKIHINTNPEIARMVREVYPNKGMLNEIGYNVIKFIVIRSLIRHLPILIGVVLLLLYFNIHFLIYPVVAFAYLVISSMSPLDGSKTPSRPTLICIISRLNDISCDAIRHIYQIDPSLIYDKDLIKMVTNITVVSDFLIGSCSDIYDGAMLKLVSVETLQIIGFLSYHHERNTERVLSIENLISRANGHKSEIELFIDKAVEEYKLIDSQYKIHSGLAFNNR